MSSQGLNEADQKELQTFLDGEQAKARVQSSVHTFTDVSLTLKRRERERELLTSSDTSDLNRLPDVLG